MNNSAFVSPVGIGQRGSFCLPRATCLPTRPAMPIPVPQPTWRMNVMSQTVFKDALLARVTPLDFGRTVVDDKKQQEDIENLIRQVEATNPSASPGTDPNLSGVWDMIYTTSTSILGVKSPSFLRSKRIVQELNGVELTARNAEFFKFGPLTVENAVEAKLTPTAPNRFDVNFTRFVIARFIKVNVEKNNRFRGWLEVSYLDEDLRISRGNEGNVFVLVKRDD